MHLNEVFPYLPVNRLEVKTAHNTGISVVGHAFLPSLTAPFVNADFNSYPVPLFKLAIMGHFVWANVDSKIRVYEMKVF